MMKQQSTARTAEKAVHSGFICDVCDMDPIVGIRYKCSVRQNFDVCEQCEKKTNQPYTMIKIRDPKQAPMNVMCQYDKMP